MRGVTGPGGGRRVWRAETPRGDGRARWGVPPARDAAPENHLIQETLVAAAPGVARLIPPESLPTSGRNFSMSGRPTSIVPRRDAKLSYARHRVVLQQNVCKRMAKQARAVNRVVRKTGANGDCPHSLARARCGPARAAGSGICSQSLSMIIFRRQRLTHYRRSDGSSSRSCSIASKP